jgi:phage FluMu protein Com
MVDMVKIKCPVCKQEANYLINEEQCFDCWEDDDSEEDDEEE